MEHPLEITFRKLGHSPAMEARIRERVAKLERWCDRILSCRIVVEADHRHHHKGNLFHVRIDLVVPGAELVAGREPPEKQAHEDAYVAIRDAFDAITRQLENYASRRRDEVKHHDTPPHGRVTAVFPAQGYGIITTSDDRSLHFHANSLVDHAFEQVAVGALVRFTEIEDGDEPRASTVHVLGKHYPDHR